MVCPNNIMLFYLLFWSHKFWMCSPYSENVSACNLNRKGYYKLWNTKLINISKRWYLKDAKYLIEAVFSFPFIYFLTFCLIESVIVTWDMSCWAHLVMLLSLRWRVISWWSGLNASVGTSDSLLEASDRVCNCARIYYTVYSGRIIYYIISKGNYYKPYMCTQLTVNPNESPVLDIKDLIVVHWKGSELG